MIVFAGTHHCKKALRLPFRVTPAGGAAALKQHSA